MTATTTDTFLRSVEGASGTVVLGKGVPALSGRVERVGEDYLMIECEEPGAMSGEPRVAVVPLSAVAYFEFDNE